MAFQRGTPVTTIWSRAGRYLGAWSGAPDAGSGGGGTGGGDTGGGDGGGGGGDPINPTNFAFLLQGGSYILLQDGSFLLL